MKQPSVKACRSCHDWDDCNGKRWYSMAEIRYCRHQVIWLISQFVRCESGKFVAYRQTWPLEEKDTGYTGAPPTQHAASAHAPFERTLQIVGDITGRLEKTGKDGRLLVLEADCGAPMSQDARNALNYISGWKEKRQGYRQWLADRKYREKR